MRKPVTFLMLTAFAAGTLSLAMWTQAQDEAAAPAAQPEAAATAPAADDHAGHDHAATPAAPAAEQAGGMTQDQRVGYLVGYQVGNGLAQQGLEITDEASFLKGIKDAMTMQDPQLSQDQIMETVQYMYQRQQAKFAEEARKNAEAGEAYLAANKAVEGVTVTESGLQYQVLAAGEGASPVSGDVAVVHYHGQLVDGSVFDSSVQRGQPAQFPVDGVIPGFSEALKMMKVGDKWKLTIPASLAYGEGGSPPRIGPNTTLIFELELLEVQAGAADQQMQQQLQQQLQQMQQQQQQQQQQ